MTVTSSRRGTSAGARATRLLVPHTAINTPMVPAANAWTAASTSSCLTILDRLAPSAVRTAISGIRADAFASSSVAIVPQPIRSTRPTAPRSR